MKKVLKLRISLCLALIVGTLTLTYGMLQGARIATIIFRSIVSIVLFGFIGYGLGIIFERYWQKALKEKDKNEGQEIDIVSEQQPLGEVCSDSEFAPFTADNFQQVTRLEE